MAEIQAHLLPPRVVVSAIVILYLCESGTNSEVALGMRQSAIRKSATPRHLSIVGRKGRAGNRAIFSDLPIRSTATGCTSAAEALLFYRDWQFGKRDPGTGRQASLSTSAGNAGGGRWRSGSSEMGP